MIIIDAISIGTGYFTNANNCCNVTIGGSTFMSVSCLIIWVFAWFSS